MTMELCREVTDYLEWVEANPQKVSRDIHDLINNIIKPTLARKDLFFDSHMYHEFLKFCEKWYYPLFPYQKFICAFVFMYENDFNGLPIFREFFIMMGRGNGKTGFAAPLVHFLLSGGHGIKEYNCDIISNSEDQARLTFDAIYNVVTDPSAKAKWARAYDITKEKITCKKTRSSVQYRTSSSKTADGFKAGILVFDELHSYQENNPLTTYKSELGKVEHPRIITITTNGYVRGAVFDRKLEQAEEVLKTGNLDRRMFPALYRIDGEKEASQEDTWIKANPSIDYFPNLKNEMEMAWIDAQNDVKEMAEFMTKRMNLPRQDTEQAITSWENILATSQPVPLNDLKNCEWVCGIDYSKLNDFAAACLLTKKDGKYYIVRQVWADVNNPFFTNIKAPLKEWHEKGLIEFVNDVEIRPELITRWVLSKIQSGMRVKCYAVDSYRFSLLRKAMENDLGVDVTNKEKLLMIRPSHIQLVVPVIDSAFNLKKICTGDDPVFRWMANNTSLVPKANGNYQYSKIEPKLRKNDLFMAFVHATCVSDKIQESHTVDNFNSLVFNF